MDRLNDPGMMLDLVRQHGRHSLAYSTLQAGMRYYGNRDTGFAAYRRRVGRYVFLGDPVCAPEQLPSFLNEASAALPDALYMQIHGSTAAHLRGLGYRITPVGVENEIETKTYSLAGKRMRDLRHYQNRARAAGLEVSEVEDTPALRALLRPVSDSWLPAKSWFSHELEFLARPFANAPEPGVRIFTGVCHSSIAAFVVLDPSYHEGVVTGYTVSILRHLPEAPEGAVDAIVLHVIATLADEGIARLSLGVSPFHRLHQLAGEYGRGSVAVFLLYLALRRWGDPVYHFRGLSFHKSRYRAEEIPVFTAVPRHFGLWSVYASARACRML